MDSCCASKQADLERLARRAEQRRVLVIALAINAGMFVIEFSAGLIAQSAALMADSADMLGDAFVYGLSLYAVDRSDRWRNGAAVTKGVLILALGLGVLVQVAVTVQSGAPPLAPLMAWTGALALCANAVCLALLWRFRSDDLNMASTVACSRNDVIANAGVLAAAGGVVVFAAPWPDIVIGLIIAAIFLRSALGVLAAAWPAFRASPN